MLRGGLQVQLPIGAMGTATSRATGRCMGRATGRARGRDTIILPESLDGPSHSRMPTGSEQRMDVDMPGALGACEQSPSREAGEQM